MGTKQSIVIVNRFSTLQPDGSGSRGATPGFYVERYMAREQATEPLAPIKLQRTDDYVLRYMARASAVESVGLSREAVKMKMSQAQGQGGVAFGYGQISLSDQQLKAASRDIQRLFTEGHTVLETVLSFDHDYLKHTGIVDEDFELSGRGGYRGHIDQMKLRMAITHGLDRMAGGTSGFDNLRYVGVIQVDTEHVHCHLAMVDAGVGNLTKDGKQKGKLLDRHKSRLRRGIDSWLDSKQHVAHLSSAVGYERRNVSAWIRRWAYEKIRDESLPQFLLACLPADRTLWRAGSNDTRMRKANELITELVTEKLERPGSPMVAAMATVTDYANKRQRDEELTTVERQRLIDNGRQQITERAVNAVYDLLKALPASELNTRTPMLEVMSTDYEQLALLAGDRAAGPDDTEDDDLLSFGFKLRSYSSRLKHHKEAATHHRGLAQQWTQADRAGVVAPESRALYEFHNNEAEYHQQLVSKYQYFLPFVGDVEPWEQRQLELVEYGQRLMALTAMRNDASLQRMKDADAAEVLGREVYQQTGGRHLTEGASGRAILDARIATMQGIYAERVDDLRLDLSSAGLVLRLTHDRDAGADDDSASVSVIDAQAHDRLRIETGIDHVFDDVKALDLHHLRYDFARDVVVGDRCADRFIDTANDRRELLYAAVDYLEKSRQSAAIVDLPVDDVASMTQLASELSVQRDAGTAPLMLRSQLAALRADMETSQGIDRRRNAASSLDAALSMRVQAQVDASVSTATAQWAQHDDTDDREAGDL